MCGIAGIFDTTGGSVDAAALAAMCAALRHRGPDGEGAYARGPIALGHRRLSIIDVECGAQPITNEDHTVWVIFNGEVYNFQDLRKTLEQKGHRFTTHSDTEVIVHAYEQFGIDCLQHFRGMFAFALWDERRQQLLLARDRLGKKPLYYAQRNGVLVFGSEIQALLAHPLVSSDPDLCSIDDYLTFGYVPAPRTAFVGITQLLPAHYLVAGARQGNGREQILRIERYWDLSYVPKLKIGEAEASERLLGELREAVRLRLIADVPLGALLSGGLDSSIVVAQMSELGHRPVKTFSVGFDEPDFDELRYARAVAQRYGTDHHELIARLESLEVLPALVRHFGQPFADSSAVPTYHVAKLTRQHVTVALNGDGGDECMGGYERYVAGGLAEWLRCVPYALREGVLAPIVRGAERTLGGGQRLRRVRRLLASADLPLSARHASFLTYFSPDAKQALFTGAFQHAVAGNDAPAWLHEQFDVLGGDSDALDSMLAADVRSYLPYDLLVKMDIASMANSLETRSPFLDHKVMELCARLPSRFKIRGLTTKYLLKRSAASLLPPKVVRRPKMGFGIPVGQWMRGPLRPLVDDLLSDSSVSRRGLFRPETVRYFVSQHVNGARDYSFQLWSLMWLELWFREMVGFESAA